MKRFLLFILVLCMATFAFSACGPDERSSTEKTTPNNSTKSPEQEAPNDHEKPNDQADKEDEITDIVYLTIGSHKITVKLEKNKATAAMVDILKQGDITYTASDYGGFEKVGALGHTLPHEDRQITTQVGDMILYSGNQIVLFYGSNSWSYTKLGTMQGSAVELKEILTESNPVTVTIGL